MEPKRHQTSLSELDDKLDEQFVQLLKKIQEKYIKFNKHIQIRIQKWVEKLLQYDENTVWRKCRNNYINLLYLMVAKGKVEGVFMRMPPQKDLPNLTDSQYKMANYQFRQRCKLDDKKNGQFSMKKVDFAQGDIGSQIITPNCQTERIIQMQNPPQYQMRKQKQRHPQPKLKSKSTKQNRLIQKISALLHKHQSQLKNDKQYYRIISIIDQHGIQEGVTQKSQSAELRVEEGIEVNKANLFQFGSPRGMTQMQYFKAALLL